MNNEINYNDNWEYCVSIASSYLSTSWREYFFETEEEAKKFYQQKKVAGYAVLMANRDEY